MNKILIINNDFDTMDLLKNWLEIKKYQVKYTGNREDVPGLLQEFEPQLIIIDSQQKEVAKQIEKEAKDSSVPVLMMTGYTANQTVVLPGSDVIEKPFDLSLFEKKIQHLISTTNNITPGEQNNLL